MTRIINKRKSAFPLLLKGRWDGTNKVCSLLHVVLIFKAYTRGWGSGPPSLKDDPWHLCRLVIGKYASYLQNSQKYRKHSEMNTSPIISFLIGLFRSTSGYINQLGFCFVLFLTNYSVECQTKSLSNICVRFTMLPIFLAILKFFAIQRLC